MRSLIAICCILVIGALAVGLTLYGLNHAPPAPDPPAQVYPPPLVSRAGLLMAGPYKKLHRHSVQYRITALHYTPSDHYTPGDDPLHMNNQGDVLCDTDYYHAGKWTRLTAKLKGTAYDSVEAYDLNDSGTVVGALVSRTSGAYTVDFSEVVVWQNGQMRELPNQPSDNVTPVAINAQGDILVNTGPASRMEEDQTTGAYLYSKAKFIDIGQDGAVWFNDRDQVVLQADPLSEASLWEKGKILPLSNPSSQANVSVSLINSRGQIVGAIDTGRTRRSPYRNATHAFFWQQGRTRDIGTFGGDDSAALGLNNSGEVVGRADTHQRAKGGEAVTHAFLWRDGKMQDLNDLIPARSGWVLSEADAVNDRGQIVGSGNRGAFLLTPLARR